jgi:hypothetical protein
MENCGHIQFQFPISVNTVKCFERSRLLKVLAVRLIAGLAAPPPLSLSADSLLSLLPLSFLSPARLLSLLSLSPALFALLP